MSAPSHITPGHVNAFQAVRSQLYDNVTLMSCWINDEPGVAIVLAEHCGEGKIGVMPLFVAITPGMRLRFEGESGSSSDGGPRRPEEEFTEAARDLCPGVSG